MRSHKLADFTDGKPCPTSHEESVATMGPEPTSATSWPELLPGHMGWASGQGGQAQLLAQSGVCLLHQNISSVTAQITPILPLLDFQCLVLCQALSRYSINIC